MRDPDHVVFSVGDRPVTWATVLALAERWGEVARIRAQAAEALAARRAGPPADPVALRAAASAFRRERHLLSGDDLRAWLAAHDLTMEQWRAQLEGALLRDRAPATAPRRAAPPAPAGVAPAELEAAAFAEAVCTGALEAWAREAAARVALAPAGASLDPTELERAFEAALARALDERALDDVMRRHETEWTAFDVEVAAFPAPSAAEEAVLCVRLDGQPLAEVAALADVAARRERWWASDVPPALTAVLLSASSGDVVGPLDGDRVVVLEAKRVPSADVGEVRERARAAARAELVERALTRVRWRDAR